MVQLAAQKPLCEGLQRVWGCEGVVEDFHGPEKRKGGVILRLPHDGRTASMPSRRHIPFAADTSHQPRAMAELNDDVGRRPVSQELLAVVRWRW